MPFDPKLLIYLGLDQIIPTKVNGRRNGVNNDPAWDADYLHHPNEILPTATIFIAPGVPDYDVTPPSARALCCPLSCDL